jgi:putative endonuclease
MKYCVYIITNKKRGTLYIGSTSELEGRIWEHKNKQFKFSFSSNYNLDKLVYYEEQDSPQAMVSRERNLKDWHRKWKLDLIEQQNPNWNNLSEDWFN